MGTCWGLQAVTGGGPDTQAGGPCNQHLLGAAAPEHRAHGEASGAAFNHARGTGLR